MLIYCLMNFPLFVGVLWLSLFCYFVMHYFVSILVLQSSWRERESLLSYRCIVTINVLWHFLTVPWVGLQCVIVVFPDAVGWSAVCDCGISWSYSLTLFKVMPYAAILWKNRGLGNYCIKLDILRYAAAAVEGKFLWFQSVRTPAAVPDGD